MKTVITTVLIAVVRAIAHCFGCCSCPNKTKEVSDEASRSQ